MNKAILIGAILTGLIALLFLAGCIDPAKADQESAIRLADNTAEGKIASAFGELFSGEKECTKEEALGIITANNANIDPETIALFEKNFEIAKNCLPEIEKSAEKTAEQKYAVSYSFKLPEDCEFPGIAGNEQEDFLIIEADLKENKIKVTKGAFPDEEARQQAALGVEMMKGQTCYYLISMASGVVNPIS